MSRDKTTFDFISALFGLLLFSPLLLAVMIAIWLEDRHSPFYIALRTLPPAKPSAWSNFVPWL